MLVKGMAGVGTDTVSASHVQYMPQAHFNEKTFASDDFNITTVNLELGGEDMHQLSNYFGKLKLKVVKAMQV